MTKNEKKIRRECAIMQLTFLGLLFLVMHALMDEIREVRSELWKFRRKNAELHKLEYETWSAGIHGLRKTCTRLEDRVDALSRQGTTMTKWSLENEEEEL